MSVVRGLCPCLCSVCGFGLVEKSCLTLFNPMDSSLPGSSVHGILQARILEWVATSFSRKSSRTQRLNPQLLHWQVDSLPLSHLGRSHKEYQFSSVAQSCTTLCNPMNRSTPGLPVHLQLPEFTQTHVHRVADTI